MFFHWKHVASWLWPLLLLLVVTRAGAQPERTQNVSSSTSTSSNEELSQGLASVEEPNLVPGNTTDPTTTSSSPALTSGHSTAQPEAVTDASTPSPEVISTTGTTTTTTASTSTSTSTSTTITSTTTTTTTTTSLAEPASELPDYLKHCFYAEEHLCEAPAPGSDEAADAAPAQPSEAEPSANSCQCKEHPSKPNSWYCCNISQVSMISSCSNISKWTNLHVRNMTVKDVDLSNPIFRSLQSLAVTDGNITRLVNAFPRLSALKCLNISNNNISEIHSRAVKDVPHLEFFGMSNNNLSLVPHRNQNKNITLDISGNRRMLCTPLNEIIHNESINFLNPGHSYCQYNATRTWFQSTDKVSVEQLENRKRCVTNCPVIPSHGNCKCTLENIMIIQDNQSKPQCHVDCSNLGLVELPQRLPDNTFVLNITNNRITSLGDYFHTNPTYHNINRLVADNNQIVSMNEFEGTKFIESFQRIYMRNNSLNKIPEYFLNNALMDSGLGRRIYLAGNKLQCDCNSAKKLLNWLKERSSDIPDYMDIRCRNIPQSVIELQEAKLCQSPPDWTDYIYYLIAAEVFLLLALIAKVSYDYWVFKTAGYLPWPASKMPKLPCDWLCES